MNREKSYTKVLNVSKEAYITEEQKQQTETPVAAPSSDGTDDIFTELASYIPDDDINGQWGLRWGYTNGVIDKPFLEEMLLVRRDQFLQGLVSPDMPKSSKRG